MISVDPDGRVGLPEWPNTFLQRSALVVAFSFMAAVAVWRWGLGILVAAAGFTTPEGMLRIIDDGHPEFGDWTWVSPSRLGTTQGNRDAPVFEWSNTVAALRVSLTTGWFFATVRPPGPTPLHCREER